MGTDSRYSLLESWIKQNLGWHNASLEVASADASFRRYFRIYHDAKSYIAMDAPPGKENIHPFIDITERLLKTATHVPAITAKNIEEGFLLMEDLGSTPYLGILNPESADLLYSDAMQAMLHMQDANLRDLPSYDAQRLYDEMALMPEWFLSMHLNIQLNNSQKDVIEDCFQRLITAISTQATGFVHRDYHSRNLMRASQNNPGVIDYQDAVIGPLTYDLVSLLRDCYIVWPQSQVRQWSLQYKTMLEQKGFIKNLSDNEFMRQVDLMGLQRHIKVLGIFARLNHRDSKPHYLNDLPLTLSYVMEIGQQHPETQQLIKLFHKFDVPSRIGSVEIPA